MSDTVTLYRYEEWGWGRIKKSIEFRTVRWCEKHDEYVAGENNHCGCEYSECCWFDNAKDRGYLKDGNTPNCTIVDKLVEA